MRHEVLKHEFAEHIPEDLQAGVVYVSVKYATAAHKCCCGCGNEVITPLSPTDWLLKFDGESISLEPSIGNWGFSCRSHYWITRNRVRWAPQWSQKMIDAGRADERGAKETYFDSTKTPTPNDTNASTERGEKGLPAKRPERKLKKRRL